MDCYTIGICSDLALGTKFTIAVKGIRPGKDAADVIAAVAGPDAMPVFAKETAVPHGESPFYPDTAEQFLAKHQNTDPTLGTISVPLNMALVAH
jgi:hypothetical protein